MRVIVALPSVSSTFTNEFIDGLKHIARLVTAESTSPAAISLRRLNLSARKPFTKRENP